MRTICYCFVNRSKLGRVNELIWQLTGVLAGVIHSRHPGRLLRACTLLKTIVDHGCQWVLHIGLENISVQGIIQRNFLSGIHSALGENGQLAGLVRDHGFELVIVHFTHVIFETTVQDGAGHFGSVTELGWQATNIAAHAQDVFSEQPEKIKPVNKQLQGVPTTFRIFASKASYVYKKKLYSAPKNCFLSLYL